MKYNKGFAPVLVLLVVFGVLAVGGGAYYAGKSSVPKTEQNYNPPATSNTNNNVTLPANTQTNDTSVLSITSISPNPANSDQTVTIKGTGFSTTQSNTVVFSSSALMVSLPSADGKTITFKPSDYATLKSGLVYVVDSSAIASGKIVKGTLFSPETATLQMAGKSNAVQFTIIPKVIPANATLNVQSILNLNNASFVAGRSSWSSYTFTVVKNRIIFGDLDGDGVNEAIAPVSYCSASCGISVYVFKLYQGKIILAEISGTAVSGAAKNINSLEIRNGLVVVTQTDFDGTRTNSYRVQLINGKLTSTPL